MSSDLEKTTPPTECPSRIQDWPRRGSANFFVEDLARQFGPTEGEGNGDSEQALLYKESTEIPTLASITFLSMGNTLNFLTDDALPAQPTLIGRSTGRAVTNYNIRPLWRLAVLTQRRL
jgi:hypothetical protein